MPIILLWVQPSSLDQEHSPRYANAYHLSEIEGLERLRQTYRVLQATTPPLSWDPGHSDPRPAPPRRPRARARNREASHHYINVVGALGRPTRW